MEVTIHSESFASVCVVEFDAQYHSDDGSTIERARDAITTNVIIAEHPNVVIDLTGTDYIGSAFVGLLFTLRQRVQEIGGRLAACGVNEQCKSVLDVTRFTDKCPVFPSRLEAIESFFQEAQHVRVTVESSW